ncbi:hypothetical protein RN607_13255 [Demequina capsici]|uniref:Lipoprotein n=1 Tax=Demequina capsici TaxID=3075620 RepID=A0AA96FBI5_9MICO|nr:hypothetical protein [Demequina sp. PMTSA13]WNM27153.1 hypothetical protein RN607_13255 [Demequina sp. PMTSA13]
MRRSSPLLALACVVALAGCGGSPGVDAPDGSTSAAAVSASSAATSSSWAGTGWDASAATVDIAFPRTLQADRKIEVRLDGVVTDDAVVVGAMLDSPRFMPTNQVAENVRIFDGYTTRVRVPLGAVVCDPPDAGTTVTLEVSVDGVVQSLTLPAPDEVLAGIAADECAMKAVQDAAPVAFGSDATRSGTDVDTTLVLTRGTAAGDVVLDSVAGSVVFDLAGIDGAVPTTLAAGSDQVVVPVRLSATRCDPHVFAESKKTFVFRVWEAVDGAAPAYVEIRPPAALQDLLQQAFDECGSSSRSE